MQVQVGGDADEQQERSPGGPAEKDQNPKTGSQQNPGLGWRQLARLAILPQPQAGAAEGQQREHRHAAEIHQVAGKQPLQDLHGPEGVPFVGRLRARVIHEVAVGDERDQFEGGKRQRHGSQQDGAADANQAWRRGIGHHGEQADGEGAHPSIDQVRQAGESQHRTGEEYAPALADGPESQPERDQQQVGRDQLRKDPEGQPTAVFHAQSALPHGGNQRRKQRRGGGRQRGQPEQPGHGKKTQGQQHHRQEPDAHKHGHQGDRLPQGEIDQDHDPVSQRLVTTEYGEPKRHFRAPEIQRVFALLHRLNHALQQGEVRDVIVLGDPADRQFRPDHHRLHEHHREQKAQDQALLMNGVHRWGRAPV